LLIISMQAAKHPPELAFGYLLADAVRLMRRDFWERSKGLKLTPALARLLFTVHKAPGSRQAELAGRLEVTPVTLGRMLDRLAKVRYVRRAPDAEDRRAFRVYVDRAGIPLVSRMERRAQHTTARALKGLSAAEQAALMRQLERICSNLSDAER
jgi:MarR family transcriptional regulator for hemolysin